MSEGIAHQIIRWRWLILLVTFLAVGLIGYGAKNVRPTSDYRVFFAEGNEQLEAYETLQNTFNKNDNVYIVIAPESGNVFNKETMRLVSELTEEGWQLPWATRVDSLTNYQHTEAVGEDDLYVADLVEDPDSLDEEVLGQISRIVMKEPLLVKRLVSDMAHTTAVNVTVQVPDDVEASSGKITEAARELVQQYREKYPSHSFYITGSILLDNAFQEASMNDMKTLVPIMMGIIVLTLALLMRSISATVGTVVVIMLSIAVGMGFMGYMGWFITPPTATAPTVIMTIAVADCVHMLVTFLHGLRSGMNKTQAMHESIRLNLQPIFITSVTTAIGFLSMNFSEAPPLREFGNIVAAGVVGAFFLSIFFLPALIMILPVKPGKARTRENNAMQSIAAFVIDNRNRLLIGISMVTLLLISAIPLNRINDAFINYFSEGITFRTDTDYIEKNLTGLYAIEYALDSGVEDGINNPEFLQDVEKFANWARTQPEVEHVFTITDVFKRLNKNMHGDREEYYKLPEDRELAAQYMLLYELSLPYGLDLTNQINITKSSTRLIVTMQNIPSYRVIELENRIADWLGNNTTTIEKFYGASPIIMFSHIGYRNVKSITIGTALALTLISMILVVALRSFKLGVISLVPNLVPAAMAFGIWGLANGNIGLSLGSAIGMTLGIVVDDTVHFLSKYQRARRELGKDAEEAVRYAFSTVGVALWTTTFVIVAGFMILSMSDFIMNVHMGLFTALTIGIALAIDFLLLPSLLLKSEGAKNNA